MIVFGLIFHQITSRNKRVVVLKTSYLLLRLSQAGKRSQQAHYWLRPHDRERTSRHRHTFNFIVSGPGPSDGPLSCKI